LGGGEIGNNGLKHKKRREMKSKNKYKIIIVIKLKILNKKRGKISLLKALDLFL
jgi:hypothetical protein